MFEFRTGKDRFNDLMLVMMKKRVGKYIVLVLDIYRHTSCLPKFIVFGICTAAGLEFCFHPPMCRPIFNIEPIISKNMI